MIYLHITRLNEKIIFLQFFNIFNIKTGIFFFLPEANWNECFVVIFTYLALKLLLKQIFFYLDFQEVQYYQIDRNIIKMKIFQSK